MVLCRVLEGLSPSTSQRQHRNRYRRTIMDDRRQTLKARLFLFIFLVGLLTLMMSRNEIQPAGAQNNLPPLTLVKNAILLEDWVRLTVDEPQ
jgi:hypothetical protein